MKSSGLWEWLVATHGGTDCEHFLQTAADEETEALAEHMANAKERQRRLRARSHMCACQHGHTHSMTACPNGAPCPEGSTVVEPE